MSWRATAHLYSGRPNPEWELPPELGAQLDELWMRLPALEEAPPERPPLGYRGYVVERPDGTRYVGVPGAVRRGDERRVDRDGEFERLVLESQP